MKKIYKALVGKHPVDEDGQIDTDNIEEWIDAGSYITYEQAKQAAYEAYENLEVPGKYTIKERFERS